MGGLRRQQPDDQLRNLDPALDRRAGDRHDLPDEDPRQEGTPGPDAQAGAAGEEEGPRTEVHLPQRRLLLQTATALLN